MTVTSLASQFSDLIVRKAPNDAVRLGQTIWVTVRFDNLNAFDIYANMRAFFKLPDTEFRTVDDPSVRVQPMKRLDVVGAPSPFGSSISIMLDEDFRFFVPAGASRTYSFFMNSHGFYFQLFNLLPTDMDGNIVNPPFLESKYFYAVGSPHAAMTEPVPQSQES